MLNEIDITSQISGNLNHWPTTKKFTIENVAPGSNLYVYGSDNFVDVDDFVGCENAGFAMNCSAITLSGDTVRDYLRSDHDSIEAFASDNDFVDRLLTVPYSNQNICITSSRFRFEPFEPTRSPEDPRYIWATANGVADNQYAAFRVPLPRVP